MIKNQEVAQQLFEMMNTALEVSDLIHQYLINEDIRNANFLAEELLAVVLSIQDISMALKQEEDGLNLPEAINSVRGSLTRIINFIVQDSAKAVHKIEFELIPLIQEMLLQFRFWGMIYPDEEKMKKYYNEERFELYRHKYVEEAEKRKEYKYELSVCIIAYNKLKYTKQCVESFLKYAPKNISYELILVNHGSSDGTKEYFESIKPDKQLDVDVNGGGVNAFTRIAEGRYLLQISNDVIVTENAVENLYKCISSDEKIGWVVPTTPNVSNLQTIPAHYETEEELFEFAKNNNISDPRRWEQRVRLCNPIDIKNLKAFTELGMWTYYFTKLRFCFPDDKNSLFLRRAGYKLILAKDAYCHHFGSVTIKSEMEQKKEVEFYNIGRLNFKKTFGIDPWGLGICYDPELYNMLEDEGKDSFSVLGINCGLGANSLKIKEIINENYGNRDVYLCNITTRKEYYDDLKGVSDEALLYEDLREWIAERTENKFSYILVEELSGQYELLDDLLLKMMEILKERGKIFIRLSDKGENDKMIKVVLKVVPRNRFVVSVKNMWLILKSEQEV